MFVGMFFFFCCVLLVLILLLLLIGYFVWVFDYELKGVDWDDLEDNIELYLVQVKLFNNIFDEFIEECIICFVNIVLQFFGFYNVEVIFYFEEEEFVIDVIFGVLLKVSNVICEIIGDGCIDDVFW